MFAKLSKKRKKKEKMYQYIKSVNCENVPFSDPEVEIKLDYLGDDFYSFLSSKDVKGIVLPKNKAEKMRYCDIESGDAKNFLLKILNYTGNVSVYIVMKKSWYKEDNPIAWKETVKFVQEIASRYDKVNFIIENEKTGIEAATAFVTAVNEKNVFSGINLSNLITERRETEIDLYEGIKSTKKTLGLVRLNESFKGRSLFLIRILLELSSMNYSGPVVLEDKETISECKRINKMIEKQSA